MKGSCLCGQIEYEVDELATPIMHCSCTTCRKAHGAAFNTGAGVKPEHFRWLKGEQLLSGFEASPGKVRYFCSNCGSPLAKLKKDTGGWVLRVATLDNDPGVRPALRIWHSHEVPWLNYMADIPVYEEWDLAR